MNPKELVWLAFWAKNMTVIRDAGMKWPGFSYSDDEWARMDALAASIGDGAYGMFLVVDAVIFIAIAALAMAAVFLPVMSYLFPNPANTPAVAFVLLLALTCFLILGLGLPVSMRMAAWFCSGEKVRANLHEAPGDRALSRYVGFQINRMIAIMCGLLVPGTLLWIAFNIRAGPVITAIKWLSIGAMALSVVYSRRSRPAAGP